MSATVQAGRLPLSRPLRQAFPEEAVRLAATGGEDYELLFVAPAAVLHQLRSYLDVSLTVIGETAADGEHGVHLLDESGQEIALENAGWDHLRRA
ncbi:MAG: hypothetical protein HYS09_08370 [Chloroflexi bacterium]|nr:hypothetical protein [Chloroflexota bacterium]